LDQDFQIAPSLPPQRFKFALRAAIRLEGVPDAVEIFALDFITITFGRMPLLSDVGFKIKCFGPQDAQAAARAAQQDSAETAARRLARLKRAALLSMSRPTLRLVILP